MKQSIDGAKHFAEIFAIAKELTIGLKSPETIEEQKKVIKMTETLLTAQINKKPVTVNIY